MKCDYAIDYTRVPALLRKGGIFGGWPLPRLWQEPFRRQRRPNENAHHGLPDLKSCSRLLMLRWKHKPPRCRFERHALASHVPPGGDLGGFRLLSGPHLAWWFH